jgi:hypothetical protein
MRIRRSPVVLYKVFDDELQQIRTPQVRMPNPLMLEQPLKHRLIAVAPPE